MVNSIQITYPRDGDRDYSRSGLNHRIHNHTAQTYRELNNTAQASGDDGHQAQDFRRS